MYRFVQDLHFFVTGEDDENELMLATVLQGFFDGVTLVLRFQICQDFPKIWNSWIGWFVLLSDSIVSFLGTMWT